MNSHLFAVATIVSPNDAIIPIIKVFRPKLSNPSPNNSIKSGKLKTGELTKNSNITKIEKLKNMVNINPRIALYRPVVLFSLTSFLPTIIVARGITIMFKIYPSCVMLLKKIFSTIYKKLPFNSGFFLSIFDLISLKMFEKSINTFSMLISFSWLIPSNMTCWYLVKIS